jgi:hypothetical protein
MMTTRNSIVNWVHAQLTAGEESDEQTEVPSKSSISRWLPPMREIRPSALRRAQGKKA